MERRGNLVLTVKPGEGIDIGDNITVTILEQRGNQVRVSVKAPRDVMVLREELKGRAAKENG